MNFEQKADEIIELATAGRGIREPLISALREASGREATQAETEATEGWEWAVVEVFGHRRHAGRTREEERFGAKVLRIDVPNKGDPDTHGWTTLFYGGSSIFSFALTDRATCLKENRPYQAPARYLPKPDADDDDDRPF